MGVIRLLLALSVVIFHTSLFPASSESPSVLVGGTVAVQAFYVISGFYMALILNEKYADRENSYGLFLTNRFLRLYPTYFAVLGLTLLSNVLPLVLGGEGGTVQRLLVSAGSLGVPATLGLVLANLLLFGQDIVMFLALDRSAHAVVFAPDLATAGTPLGEFLLVPQAWTIAVELSFYLVAPFLVGRSARLLLLTVVASLIVRFVVYGFGYNVDPWTYRFFPFEIAFFLSGAIAYKVFERFRTAPWADVAGWVGWTTIVFCTLLFPYIPLPFTSKQWIYYGALACAVPFIFSFSSRNRTDRWIGELSYPIYMGHMLIIGYGRRVPYVSEKFFPVVACVAAVVFAVALNRFIQEPVERIRQSRVSRRPLMAVVS